MSLARAIRMIASGVVLVGLGKRMPETGTSDTPSQSPTADWF